MDVLKDLLKDVLTAQTGSLLIVFGMALLLLAIIGAVQGKIALDRKARLIGGTLGLISLISGVWLQTHARPASDWERGLPARRIDSGAAFFWCFNMLYVSPVQRRGLP